MTNQLKHGLMNMHIAFAADPVDGEPAWETPVAIPGAVQLSVAPSGQAQTFYGDNGRWATFNAGGNVTGTLQLWNIPPDIRARMLGDYIDSAGKYVETNEQGETFALLGQQEGTASNTRFVYYNCTAAKSEYTYDTDQDTPQAKQDTAAITATRQYFPSLDTAAMASYADSTGAPGAYAAFFSAVKPPLAPPE
jgi:phi13 family phage major tail protein